MVNSFMRLACLTGAILLLTGCGAKIKDEKQGEVDLGETKPFFAEAPSANHPVRVELTSDQPVNVAIYMSSDIKSSDPTSGSDLKKALARAEKSTNVSLDVTIPRKEEFTVEVVAAGKKAKFTLKINSQ